MTYDGFRSADFAAPMALTMDQKRKIQAPEALALDLEGTLVTNAFSLFVRPELHAFLIRCRSLFPRIVLFTAVTEHGVRDILRILVDEGSVPDWMEDVEIVYWQKPKKDLRFVRGVDPDQVVIVDDQEAYIHPNQTGNWVPLVPYEVPDEGGWRGTEALELFRATCGVRWPRGRRAQPLGHYWGETGEILDVLLFLESLGDRCDNVAIVAHKGKAHLGSRCWTASPLPGHAPRPPWLRL